MLLNVCSVIVLLLCKNKKSVEQEEMLLICEDMRPSHDAQKREARKDGSERQKKRKKNRESMDF